MLKQYLLPFEIFSLLKDQFYSRKIENLFHKKVQIGKDQEKAQSEKDSHSKNRGGKKLNLKSGTYTMKTKVKLTIFPSRIKTNGLKSVDDRKWS